MSAIISPCQRYRYELRRPVAVVRGVWDRRPANGPVLFLMLNPSTANATLNDPTIRRCIGFAQDWRHDELVVGNLYAFRATDPKDLWKNEAPAGPDNDTHLREMVKECRKVVCAWGTNAMPGRVRDVVTIIREMDGKMLCLGVTKHGHPRHPLYLPKTAELMPWEPNVTPRGSWVMP